MRCRFLQLVMRNESKTAKNNNRQDYPDLWHPVSVIAVHRPAAPLRQATFHSLPNVSEGIPPTPQADQQPPATNSYHTHSKHTAAAVTKTFASDFPPETAIAAIRAFLLPTDSVISITESSPLGFFCRNTPICVKWSSRFSHPQEPIGVGRIFSITTQNCI